MTANRLYIRNDILVSQPFLAPALRSSSADLILKVDRTFTGDPYIVHVSSKSHAFKATTIPAKIFLSSDVVKILAYVEGMGATIDG